MTVKKALFLEKYLIFYTVFTEIQLQIILLMVLSASCTTRHEQKDVYRYIKKTYALKDVRKSNERSSQAKMVMWTVSGKSLPTI